MIGRITGTLLEVHNTVGLIETASGLCYEVYLPSSLISSTSPNSSISLYTYLQVRDDALVLFGFSSRKEHSLFLMLLDVPGVGPKTAFSVISYANPDEVIEAVKKNDLAYFSRIPGLGKKTAMKIILELSQKMKDEFHMEKMYLNEEDKTVVDALISLGYKAAEAKELLAKLPKNISLEEKIKTALRIKK